MDDERKPMANIPPFGLRMQPELKARIEEAARANNRSLNAEIVMRLESYDACSTGELAKLAQERDQAQREITSLNKSIKEMMETSENYKKIIDDLSGIIETLRSALQEGTRLRESRIELFKIANSSQREIFDIIEEIYKDSPERIISILNRGRSINDEISKFLT